MEGIANNTNQEKGTNQWIWGFIEYNIESARAITTCFGDQEKPVRPTILLKNIHLTIIATRIQYIYTVKKMKTMQVPGCVIPGRKLL